MVARSTIYTLCTWINDDGTVSEQNMCYIIKETLWSYFSTGWFSKLQLFLALQVDTCFITFLRNDPQWCCERYLPTFLKFIFHLLCNWFSNLACLLNHMDPVMVAGNLERPNNITKHISLLSVRAFCLKQKVESYMFISAQICSRTNSSCHDITGIYNVDIQ